VTATSLPKPPLTAWSAVVSAWAVSLCALLAWILWTPWFALRTQLTLLQFWSLEICVALGLVVGAFVLWDYVRGVARRDLLPVLLPVALAVGLTVGVAPRTNRIYYDEQIYQNIGQNLADLRRAQLCNDGAIVRGRLQCASGEYNKQPYAYPHALSLVFRIFGVGPTAAFVMNAFATGLSVCFVYLLVMALFDDRLAALFAATVLALTPEQIVWSASAAVEPSASLACLAALLATACFIRSRRTTALAGTAIATAYAIQFRAESFLIVPVVLFLIWQRAPEEFTRPRLWWAGLLFVALAAVHAGHLTAVRNEGWGTTRDRFSLGYVAANLRVNGWFYLGDPRFPLIYTLLAALGLTGRRTGAGRGAVALYFLLFVGIAVLFYAGSYNYGADVRYSLATYPPLAILAGLGAARLLRGVMRSEPGLPAVYSLMALLAAQFIWYLPIVGSTADSAVAARADVRFARSLVPDIPDNAYVLTQNPGMFQVWGINAGQISLALNTRRLTELAARYPGGLYLHWNFWCNVPDPVQQGFCTKLMALRPVEPVREHAEEGQHFALYRLKEAPP
jgi:hypothetical protein